MKRCYQFLKAFNRHHDRKANQSEQRHNSILPLFLYFFDFSSEIQLPITFSRAIVLSPIFFCPNFEKLKVYRRFVPLE
ncbi:hypothetical protein L1987_72552 [Smallanthus sonchifolius]|uniref:Uncharacterized protein n=1 Tax=Smallanthus sonchifolius TaxID=185202 RepID=A0ACB9AW82_9ASTR|nr:hypothetical protein L1987_72552 [Smallanthus sonchifolius]